MKKAKIIGIFLFPLFLSLIIGEKRELFAFHETVTVWCISLKQKPLLEMIKKVFSMVGPFFRPLFSFLHCIIFPLFGRSVFFYKIIFGMGTGMAGVSMYLFFHRLLNEKQKERDLAFLIALFTLCSPSFFIDLIIRLNLPSITGVAMCFISGYILLGEKKSHFIYIIVAILTCFSGEMGRLYILPFLIALGLWYPHQLKTHRFFLGYVIIFSVISIVPHISHLRMDFEIPSLSFFIKNLTIVWEGHLYSLGFLFPFVSLLYLANGGKIIEFGLWALIFISLLTLPPLLYPKISPSFFLFSYPFPFQWIILSFLNFASLLFLSWRGERHSRVSAFYSVFIPFLWHMVTLSVFPFYSPRYFIISHPFYLYLGMRYFENKWKTLPGKIISSVIVASFFYNSFAMGYNVLEENKIRILTESYMKTFISSLIKKGKEPTHILNSGSGVFEYYHPGTDFQFLYSFKGKMITLPFHTFFQEKGFSRFLQPEFKGTTFLFLIFYSPFKGPERTHNLSEILNDPFWGKFALTSSILTEVIPKREFMETLHPFRPVTERSITFSLFPAFPWEVREHGLNLLTYTLFIEVLFYPSP